MTTPSIQPTRLPRYMRADAKLHLALTHRDLYILRLVESFRLMTSEQICALTEGSAQGILRRLQKLFHTGYLDRLPRKFVHGGGSAKMIYAITNRGISALQKEGLIQNPSNTDRNAKNSDLHDRFVDHRLLISQIRATFMLACRKRKDVQFLFWREGRQIQDSIEVALPNRYATVPVAADGFFGLRSAKGRTNYLVEADCGSMSCKRFTLKLKGFAAYYKEKKHTDKFGIKNFRVLSVASGREHCRNLVKAAAAEEDVREHPKRFLFTAEENLALSAPEKVFEKIWTMPGTEEPCSILG